MTGAEISAAGDKLLHSVGAVVLNFGSNRYTPAGMRGWVDKVVFWRGTIYLIEVKGDGDNLRPDQIKFYRMVLPHLSHCLRYVLADSVDVFVLLIEGGCRPVEVPERWLDKLTEAEK